MKELRFKNGKFKIMQIADIQENYQLNPDTIKLISLALDKEKPDLVVLTGDQIQGYSGCYLKDAEMKVMHVIDEFIAPIKERNIPFAVTFGNHDDDCKCSRQLQMEHYTSFDNCVYAEPRCEEDPGTFAITVKNSEDKDALAIYLFDTGKAVMNGASFPPVKKEQIEWYQEKRDSFKDTVGDYLPGIVFQHIPVPEYFDIINKVNFFTKGRVEAYKSRKNTFYSLDKETLAKGCFMYEAPAAPDINAGQFDALKEKGDIFAMYVGHDHNNSFYKNLDGIDLGYCQGAGFNTYGPGNKRGVRLFEFDENNVRNYRTYCTTMGDLCNYKYKPAKPFLEFVFRNAPVSPDQAITDFSRVALGVGTVVVGAKLIKKLLK